MAPKRKVSYAQLAILISAMEQNRALAHGSNAAGIEEKKNLDHSWCSLVNRLNSEPGDTKTLTKWRTYWNELKYGVRRKAARLRSQSSGAAIIGPQATPLNEMEQQILSLITTSAESQSQVSHIEPSKIEVQRTISDPVPKSEFKKVRRCCVALIMKHGRTADLLDDAAFRELLNLIPMTEEQRGKLTSISIKEFLDDDEQSYADSFDDTDGADEMYGDSYDKTYEEVKKDNPPKKVKIKKEPADCSCPLRDGRSHETDCSAIAQEIWQYFELSTDEATCKLCSKDFQWTGTLDLKVHLALNHPSVGLADLENIGEVRAVGNNKQISNPEMLVCDVTIEESLSEDLPSTAKKRKCPATTLVTHEDSKRCLERFQSIEQFGQYIASLMKLLPVEKSLKYQEQFVQTLIREQAAAG